MSTFGNFFPALGVQDQLERGGAAHLSGAQAVLHHPQLSDRADPHPTRGTVVSECRRGGDFLVH